MLMRKQLEGPLTVTVSGSFKRHLGAIQGAVAGFIARKVEVLSPADPVIVDTFGDFAFVASDHRRTIKGIQNRHLAAISQSDFLWLCCEDGYVGQSAAMEVGYAVALGIPIFSATVPSDFTLRQYVMVAGSIDQALAFHSGQRISDNHPSGALLLDPERTLLAARDCLDIVEDQLLDGARYSTDDPVGETVQEVRRLLELPS